MSPEFLKAFGPMFGQTPTLQFEEEDPQIQGAGPLPAPSFSYDPGTQAPGLRQKRGIGNVLHDLFADHTDAKGVPLSEKLAALGNAFTNSARSWRGQDTIDTVTPMRQARWDVAEHERQQNAIADAMKAKALFGNLLTNPQAGDFEQFARLDPEGANSFLQARQATARQTAQDERQARIDDYNMGKPVSVGGNTYLTPKEGGGWEEHQLPVPPGYQITTSGDGQTYVVDKRTGTPVRAIGGKKILPNKVITVQGENGPEVRMIDANGNPVRTIGAAVPKGGATANSKLDPAALKSATSLVDNLDDAFKRLNDAGGMSHQGQTMLGRAGAWALGSVPGAARLTNGKAYSAQQDIERLLGQGIQQLVPLLGGTKLGGKNIDAAAELNFWKNAISSATDYESAQRAIKGFRNRIAELSQGQGSATPSVGGNDGAIAEARRRGLIK